MNKSKSSGEPLKPDASKGLTPNPLTQCGPGPGNPILVTESEIHSPGFLQPPGRAILIPLQNDNHLPYFYRPLGEKITSFLQDLSSSTEPTGKLVQPWLVIYFLSKKPLSIM